MNGLFRNLRADEIDVRVATINDKGMSILLYKDARCDMNILDEKFTPMGWQRDHKELKGNIYCGVSIWNEKSEDWITKWDAGAESFTEAVKGEASDSFKRACFNWGIGRELYTSPFIWIKPKDGKEIFKNNKGKHATYTKFIVSKIVTVDGLISELEIKDNEGKVRYTFGNKKTTPSKPNEESKKIVATVDQVTTIKDLAEEKQVSDVDMKKVLSSLKVSKIEDLTIQQASDLIKRMSAK